MIVESKLNMFESGREGAANFTSDIDSYLTQIDHINTQLNAFRAKFS